MAFAGIYVVYFCQERGIDTSQIKMTLQFDRNETKHLVESVRIYTYILISTRNAIKELALYIFRLKTDR